MSEMVKSQPDGSTREKAQEAIRNLLDGNPPNGIQPEECGEYREIVSALYDAYSDGGADAVSRLALELAYENEQLMALMAGDEPDEEDEPETDVQPALTGSLSNGVKVFSWADKEHEFGPIEWSWPGWIPRNLLVMVVGASGCGKSLFVLSGICSSFILGSDFPDGTPYEGETGKILWIETEEGFALNIDRARTLGLPLDSFISLELEDGLSVGLEQKKHRDAILEVAMRPEVVAVVIDSLSGGHGADENSTEMLRITGWLAFLARVTHKPVILNHHLNKLEVMPGEDIAPRHVRGSTSILQYPRVTIGINYAKADDDSLRRLNIVKANMKHPKPIVFAIQENGGFAKADPTAYIETTNPRLPDRQEELQELAAILNGLVEDGEKSALDVYMAVTEAGLSYDKAKRLKEHLGIKTVKKADGWYWRKIQD